MIRITRFALATLACAYLCACSKEDPNPELRDPIFQDLEKRHADQDKAAEEASKNLGELKIKLEKAEDNSIEKKDIQRDIAKNQKIFNISSQLAHYYKIRTERRKIVDKLVYKEALAAKKDWPDPHEYSDYLVNRRLVEASRNWAQRVPKLTDRIPSSTKPSAKPNPKAEKKEE
jgi:hypothetical protein